MDTVAEIRLRNKWLNASQRPVYLKDTETEELYRLDVEGVSRTASLNPKDFSVQIQISESDDRDPIPVSIDDIHRAAEAVYFGRLPAWVLWELTKRRRQ